MRLTRLELRDVPGIDRRGLTLDGLDAAVVLVLGPNGAGKSTARRCLAQLLFKSDSALVHAHIVGTFVLDDGTAARAEQRHGQVVWTRDGEPTTPPSLPHEVYSGCFAVSAIDLLQAGTTEQGFATTVRREMSGGYDVAAVRDAVAAPALGPQYGLALSKEVATAKKKLREVEGDLDALADEEDRLVELKAEKLAADKDGVRRTELRAKLDELERAIEGEPALAARVHRSARAVARLDAERSDLDALGPLPAADKLATAIQLASELQRIDADLNRAREDLARARAAQAAARGDLEGAACDGLEGGGLEGVRTPTPADLVEIQSAWTEGSKIRSELVALDKALALLPAAEDGAHSLRALDAALDDLSRWLANAPRAASRPRRGLILAASLLALASTIAAVMLTPWLVVGTGVGVALAAALVLGTPTDDASRAAREQAAAAYERSQFAAPKEWEAGSVERLLHDLRGERDHASRLEHAATDRERLTRDRSETQAQLQAREATLDAMRETLGLAAGRGGLDLSILAQRILVLDGAEVASASAAGALESQLARRTELEARAVMALGLDSSSKIDPTAMHQRVAALQERATKIEARAGEHAREVARHAEAVEAHEARRRQIRAAAAALAVEPHEPLDEARARLAAQIQTLDESLERRDGLLRKVERTETRLANAREQGEWEVARAARARREERLAEAFAARVDALCAGTLLDEIESEYERASRPAVLERAAALFAGFTHDRYDLVALRGTDGEARFAANDADMGERRSLAQLSDGTRMQLLLALRIAFAEHHERGETVPVVLDEAFSMSDRSRVEAMIEAVGHLAREGRQVLYLGADGALEAEWNRVARGAGYDTPRVCRIADAQRAARSVAAPAELALAGGPDVPDPGGFTPEDYGRTVGVGLLDPHDDAGSLHLFHLLRDDLPSLAKLLRQRIGTLGRWEALVARGGDVLAIGDADVAADLTARAAAARALVEAWHVSRGFPVGRAELVASKAVTDTFLDKMSEYLADTGGDAAVLFEELGKPGAKRDERLKGFRDAKVSALRAYLVEVGALDLQAPLSAEVQDERAREAAPTLEPVVATQLAGAIRAQLERAAVAPVS